MGGGGQGGGNERLYTIGGMNGKIGGWVGGWVRYLDEHTGLVVGVGGEGLRLLGGHRGVPFDEGGHHPPSSLKAEGEGRDVEEEEVAEFLALIVAREDGGLHGGAVGDSLCVGWVGGWVECVGWVDGIKKSWFRMVGLGGWVGGERGRTVGVDGLARLLPVEEVDEHGLDLGDAGGAAHQDDCVGR